MADVYSDAYWTTQFAITQSDLDRLAGFITTQNQAQNLGTLIKRVVRGRLRHGHDPSVPIIDETVRMGINYSK